VSVRPDVEERRHGRSRTVRAPQSESHGARYAPLGGGSKHSGAAVIRGRAEARTAEPRQLAPRRLGPLAPMKGSATCASITTRSPDPDVSIRPAGFAPDDVPHGMTPCSVSDASPLPNR
jgi:hypothetical protein